MKILDRYIIRMFLQNYLLLLAVLLSLFTVMDFLADMDEFILCGRVYAEDYGGQTFAMLVSIFDYYWPLLLLFAVTFTSLVVYGAMGFTLLSLLHSRESVAMLTSGMSLFRIAAPVFLVGGALILVVLPLQEFVIPRIAHKIVRNKSQLKVRNASAFFVRYAPDGRGSLFTSHRFNLEQQMLEKLSILVMDDQGRQTRRVVAAQAFWDEQRQGWRLVDGYSTSASAVMRSSVDADDPFAGAEPDDVTPIDFFPTDLSPDVLMARKAGFYTRLLSLDTLNRLQNNQAIEGDSVLRVAQSRFSYAVVGLLLMLIGTPFYLRRTPRDFLKEGAKATFVGLVVWGSGVLLLQIEIEGMSPMVNAWLPVILFLPLAGFNLQLVRS